MHFEILVEDQSGKTALDILLPKIIGSSHTYKVYPYKGCGRIPKNLSGKADPQKRQLLDRLPKLLRGFARTHAQYSPSTLAVVIVVVDLDNRCQKEFLAELHQLLSRCLPRPVAHFCLAIEEGEAWLLGDLPAINSAYPNAEEKVLSSYVNDEICGTWEKLADAIYPGGSAVLRKANWGDRGRIKSEWAANICPHLDIENNRSPSFIYFRDKLRKCVMGCKSGDKMIE